MATQFDLIITTDAPNLTAEFRLLDAHGSQIAYRQTDFKTITVSHKQGLFDLRNYVSLYVEEKDEAVAVAEIGICIAEKVLGQEIFEKLWQPESQRTLRIQLPGALEEKNYLTAALARVPWEIARPRADEPTLSERNLLVRVVHDMQAPASQPVELASDESLRVLFVFAEARGSHPLGVRQERRELLRLFEKEIYPQRRVVAHFLTHGVTRGRLEDQIRDNGGYHIVHWSGHGHLNLLELAKPGGAKDHLSGGDLLRLFTHVGGFLPRLVFLSACHSGDIVRVRDWADFLAIAQGKEPRAKDTKARQLDLKQQPGFTGTAHALLQGGVPSAVAMRYDVGDDYARELAVEFYRALLAHTQPKNVAAALTIARQSLLDGKKHDPARFAICDHATPVLYGAEQLGLTLARGPSPDLNPRNRHLHQITELTTASHEHFVGRVWELAGLGTDFIGSRAGAEVKPVAIITGLGGMGKTALVAEALALWEVRFEWVLLYQAKPNPLAFEATLRDIHLKLTAELGRYHEHVGAWPADAIYRDAASEFTGPERLERLTRNLIRALKDEAILLVLDNFETNLKPQAEPAPAAGQSVWACQDPAWDRFLALLARELVGSPSRVLITSRRPLAALADGAVHPVLLGPLPPAEAALFLQAHPALSQMVLGGDGGERALAQRLLSASRFHPLLMDRLARLAAAPSLRPQLLQALDTLERTKDFAQLPALFATSPGDARELAYLDNALTASLDQLIRGVSIDARRLLWMIAVAKGPVASRLLESVWSRENLEQQLLRRLKQMLDRLPLLPAKLQAKLNTMPPEIRRMLDILPPEAPSGPKIDSLLRHLVSVGLATEDRTGPEDDNPAVTSHELVRERIRDWIEQHPHDRGELTENALCLAFAERLEIMFNVLQHQSMADALQAGSCALVYYVQAGAWDRLGGLASRLVTSTEDPRLLDGLIPHLQTAAESAPDGRERWLCIFYLADALRMRGRPDVSLPFFEQAAALARPVTEAGGDRSLEAWGDLANIWANWASALSYVGNLDVSRQRRLDAAEAQKKAGHTAVDVIANELEALRIDIMQGKAAAALPQVEARLAQVDAWWKLHRSGQPVPGEPDTESLARALITALDVARNADDAQQAWESALDRIDAQLAVMRTLKRPAEEIGVTRFNRAGLLAKLPGHLAAAKAELEDCLRLFQSRPDHCAKVLNSLAGVFARGGDVVQAIIQQRRAIAIFEEFPDPADRAVSHNNLALYLERSGTPSALAEAPHHQLTALTYRLVAGLKQDLEGSLRHYGLDSRRAYAAGVELAVPRVAQFLADPASQPLEQWLRQRQVKVEELQADVDRLLEQARQTGLQQ